MSSLWESTTKRTNHCCKVSTGSHHRHWVPNNTTLTAAALLPSCFLSTQEAASARGVGGWVCEVVSGEREGAGGHSLPLRQPGARCLGRDGRPHQGHQRPNPGGAEEDGVGGAGPPVDTPRIDTHNSLYMKMNMFHRTPQITSSYRAFYAFLYLYSKMYMWTLCYRLKINALLLYF